MGNPRGAPEISPVHTEDIDYEATDGNRLRILGSAPNDGRAERLTMIKVRVSVGGERTTQSRELTVPADGTVDSEVKFDVEYNAFSDDGNLNISLV